jgi:hypothetical protein
VSGIFLLENKKKLKEIFYLSQVPCGSQMRKIFEETENALL